MKPFYQKQLVLSILFFLSIVLSFGQFVHPGGFSTQSDLDFIKQKVNAGEQPWKGAFDQLKNGQWGKMSYTHKAYSHVKCGSHNNPNIGCEDQVYDAMAAYAQALQWYITGDQKHADKAMTILDAWSGKYVKNEDFNDKLVASWATPWFVNAAEIIRYSNAGWSTAKVNQFKGMLNKLYYFTTYGGMFNNGLMSQIEAQFAIAIFLDDQTKYNKAKSEWNNHTKTYFYLKSDGPKPHTGRRTLSVWGNTSYVEGQCMETCRDYGHSKLGFNSIVGSAAMAYSQGDDLFNNEKNRLRAFMETHAKWTTGKASVPGNVCGGKVKCIGTSSSPLMPCGKDRWDIAYRHLHDRLGLTLNETNSMINSSGNRAMGRWNTKPETLIAHGVPFGGVVISNNPPIVNFLSPESSSITVNEGYALSIQVEATDSDGSIDSVVVYIDNARVRRESQAPYDWGHTNSPNPDELNGMSVGAHEIKAVAFDNEGASSEMILTVIVQEVGVYVLYPIHDAYIQGGNGFNNEDLRVEADSRTSYLKFDMSGIPSGAISRARLELSVGNDDGEGNLRLYQGLHDNWIEDNISTANAPLSGNLIDEQDKIYSTGNVYDFDLVTSDFSQQEVTFIIEMDAGGNDVSFASKEHTSVDGPKLVVKVDEVLTVEDMDQNVLSVFPNPSTSGKFQLSNHASYNIFNMSGLLVKEGQGKEIDLTKESKGVYLLMIQGRAVRLVIN